MHPIALRVISSAARDLSDSVAFQRRKISHFVRNDTTGICRKRFTFFLIALASVSWLSTIPLHAAEKLEKLRAAYPAVAPGSTPSWITAEKKIWQKYGFEVEPILVSGGARAVPALLGQSVQFLFGSDTGVTTAQLQGIPVVRLGVTMNTLGSSLLTQPNIQSVQDLKGKILGISRGRDASYIRLAKLLRDNGLNPNEDVKFLSIGGGEGGRLSAVKAGVIHGTMLFPPLDLIARNEGLKVLAEIRCADARAAASTRPRRCSNKTARWWSIFSRATSKAFTT